MFRTPQSILKHRPLEDNGGSDGGKQYDIRTSTKKQQIIEIGTETETATATTSNNHNNSDVVSIGDSMYIEDDFARNRSNETYSTANSSGIYSLELLKEIYPALSETDSAFGGGEGEAQEEDQDDYDEVDTVIHTNHHYKDDEDGSFNAGIKMAKDDDDDQKDFPLCSFVYNKVLTTNQINRMSSWEEDRPFDEESLRALSDKQLSENGGDYCVETIYANKDFSLPVKEYILPPFDGNDDDDDDSIPPPAPPPPTLMKNTVHVPAMYNSANNSSHDGFLRSSNDEESRTRSITSSTRAIDEDNKRGMTQKRYWLILCILITLLLAGALVIGFTVPRNRNDSDELNNQPIVSSIDSNESSAQLNDTDAGDSSTTTSSTSDTSLTEEPVTPPTEPSQEQDSAAVLSSDNLWSDNTEDPSNSSWGNILGYTEPIPQSYFPLGFCEGDCDRNSDCAEGLVCVQRGPNDPVPFCHGGENDATRTDYCTYKSRTDFESGSGSEEGPTEECISTITVTQECYFWTENVIVVNFVNCDPSNGDWVGIYADGTSVEDANTASEWLSDDYIDWAFTCGEQGCNDSPSTYSFAFSTKGNSAYDFLSLRAYVLSYTTDTRPPYEVIAKTEPFIPTQVCQ
jgi:hypothetical protein